MRAAVLSALGGPLVVEDRPDPSPAAADVVIRVARCGICGSDLHMSEDAAFGASAGDVFGHEFAGEVVALGALARGQGLAPGDLVSVSPLKSCGTCQHCRRGEVQWCDQFGLQGGGYAEYALTRPNQCIKLPLGVSLSDGAIIEPLAVALHGVRLSGLVPGQSVLVLGAGPIGLAVAFWAKRQGAARVVVQDIAEWQRARAMMMGADAFIAEPADPVGASERAFARGKPDVVFECVGLPGLIAQAVQQVRNRGTILLLGLCTRPDTFDSFAMLQKEVRLLTSAFFTRRDFEDALDALSAGASEPAQLISATIPLADTPAMFEALKHRTHQCKVIIAP